MMKKLVLAAALALLPVGAHAAQATYGMPTSGPLSMSAFVGSDLNPALSAILSHNSGTSAPSVSGQPATYQDWMDTSASPKVWKLYDGASWVQLGQLDSTGHTWSPVGAKVTLNGSTSGATIVQPAATASGTLTLPAATDTLVGRATTDTLTNKSLSGSSNTFTSLPNSALTNSSVTVAGHAISLGGSATIACGDLSNGVASCSTDTTNASNISTGTLAAARGGAGTISGALKGNGSGVVSQAACADLSNGATGCSTATGTSGATIPLLNGANTWSGVQSFNDGDVSLKGATSGTLALHAAATAGTGSLTFPAGTTDFSATGGTSQVVKQTSTGAALTVGRLTCGDLSDAAASCSTDATNAGNIGSGTLAAARGGAGTISGALKGNGAGVVSQAACADLSNAAASCSTDTTNAGNISSGTLSASRLPTVPVANGGTGQTTAVAARGSSGLNIDQATAHGDSAYAILSTDRTVITSASLTAQRTWTLPPANALTAGQHLVVADMAGGINGANTLVIAAAGTDTVNGGASYTLSSQYGYVDLVSDGSGKWVFQPAGGGGGGSGTVTSVTCGTGLSGGTFSTSGTCALASISGHSYLGNNSGSSAVPSAVSAANLGTDLAGLVAATATDRQNALLACADMSKALAVAVRRIETYCDGYKASDGINSGSSSNYTLNTTSGYVGPTPGGNDANTMFLLHMDGTNGSTTFTDSSSNALTVTANGNAQISTAQSEFGGASGLFDGTGDYLSIADNALLEPGSSDFTIDMWVRPSIVNSGQRTLISKRALNASYTPVSLSINPSGQLSLLMSTSGSSWAFTGASTATVAVNQWAHVALVRSGTAFNVYLNGTSVLSATLSGALYNGGDPWTIGRDNTGNDFAGNIDEFRYSVGVARWTANFTPPTQAYSTSPLNATIVTTTQTADTTVSNARALLEIDPIDSITLGTDLTAEVTCNGGTNWASGTLSSVGKGQAGRTVVETADTSCGANTGTSFAARIKTLNNKSVNVYKTTVAVH